MNLTPEQLEFLFYLLGALLIGFLFGYLLAKSIARSRYTAEIDELSDLLDHRDREIETASAKHVQLKQHMAVQANEIQDLTQKVTDAQDVISKLEDNIKLLKDEKIELSSLAERKDEQLAEAYSEINSIKSMLDEHKKEKDLYSVKLEDRSKEIEHHSNIAKELSLKNNEYQVKIKELEEKLNNEKKELHLLNELKVENETIKKTIADKNNIIASLESKNSELAQKDNDVKEQIQTLNNLKDENISLKQKYDNVIKIIDEKNAEIATLESKSKDLMNKDENYNILQNALEDSKNEISRKEDTILNLEKKIDELKNIANNSHDDGQVAILKNEIQEIKDKLLHKDNALKMTEDKLRLSHEEITRMKLDIKKLSSERDNAKSIAQLSGNDKSNTGWGLSDIVKNVFSSKDKN